MRSLALLFLLPVAAIAAPSTTGFDGRLLNAEGAPINGAHIVTITLHSAATGDSPEWSENHGITAVDG